MSIIELVDVGFVYGKKTPYEIHALENINLKIEDNDRIGLIGTNGSGKTNIGLAIFDIANHLSHKWKKPDYYLNFVSAINYLQPVEFEYCFKFDNRWLKYSYAKTTKDGQIIIVKDVRIMLF